MKSGKPRRLRHAALRAVFDSRMTLAGLSSIEDEKIRNLLLAKLSPTLLTATRPDSCAPGRRVESEPDSKFNHWRDVIYLRVIMALASDSQSCTQLLTDVHIE